MLLCTSCHRNRGRVLQKQRRWPRQLEKQKGSGPFLSFPKPLFQSEVECEAIDMKIIFLSQKEMQIKLIFTRKVLHVASF